MNYYSWKKQQCYNTISLSLIVWQRHCLWVCGSHPQLTVNLGYSVLPWSVGSWWLPFHWNYNMFLCSLVQGDSWGKKRKDALISIPTLLEVLLLHLSHVHYRGWWKQVQLYSLWWNILLKLSFKKRERNSILCMKRIFHFSL